MTGGVSRGAAAGLHGPMGEEKKDEREVESAKLKGVTFDKQVIK